MHKVFGEKNINEHYRDRVGAYLIPYQDGKIGIVKTSKGYFLIGGGMDEGESLTDCLKRECLEETGYSCSIEGEVCTGEKYMNHPTIGYFHPIQTFYYGRLTKAVCAPIEKDHTLHWVERDKACGMLLSELQSWALGQFLDNVK